MNFELGKVVLAVLSIVTGVANFVGINATIAQDAWQWKIFSLLISIGVAGVIYLFWVYAFFTVVNAQKLQYRLSAWGVVCLGCAVLVALSSWWNVTAIAANEVTRLADKEITQNITLIFNKAVKESGKYKSFVPDVSALATNIKNLAESEETSGAITGSPGKGSITEFLRQLEVKALGIVETAQQASQQVELLRQKGQNCLNALHGNSPLSFKQVDCVNTAIADLGNQNVLQSLKRSLSDFTSGIIIPVSIRKQKQKEAVSRILANLKAQANKIANNAWRVTSNTIAPVQVERPNAMWAVVIYAPDILPAWITGIALDLAPLILLGFMSIHRRDVVAAGQPTREWTVRELKEAQQQLRELDELKSKETLPLKSIEDHSNDGPVIEHEETKE